MGVSKERIDELFEQMLDNTDENGWCHIPEGLDKEVEDELSKKIALITMQDRIDNLMEGIFTVMGHIEDIKNRIDTYDTMERLKIKGVVSMLKEDSQSILMDMHSTNKLKDFFRIDFVKYENETSRKEMEVIKSHMETLVDTEFKESMTDIKKYCGVVIEMCDDLIDIINIKK